MTEDEWVAGSLLAYVAADDREFLLDRGQSRWFAPNDVLMMHGDPTNHVFILLSGWVRVSLSTREDQEILLGLRGPGDVLGELAALYGWPRTATVKAMDRVRVVQFTKAEFVASLYERPAIAIGMAKQMGSRLREAESIRVDVATMDVAHRVAAYLLWLSDTHGVPGDDGIVINVPLTQQDLASRVGASLRAVTRSMALLRERGILATSRPRQTVIRQPEVLRSFTLSTPNDM